MTHPVFQERAVPLILEGKDLLARGRTGSGKTGAFCVPLVQRLLEIKAGDASAKQVKNVAILNWSVFGMYKFLHLSP